MNYIITKRKEYFQQIGEYNYCNFEDMILPSIIAFDSETEGLQARKNDMFCCQIGNGQGDNYIIDMYDNNYSFYDVIPYIQDKTLVGHNILFDLGFMYKYNFFPKNVRDTMLASKIIYNGDIENIQNDFGTCMQRELNLIYDKTDQKNIHIVKLSQPSTIKYSFNDVDKLLELHAVLEKKIDEGGFRPTYDFHCQYIRALAYIEQCGMPISSEAWKKKMEEDIKNASEWKTKIEEYLFDNFICYRNNQIDMFNPVKRINVSITSPLQMIKVFQKLGIPTKDKDGKDSINENIISKSSHEFVKMWLSYQEANHRVTTFGETIYKQIENERIYTNFNPMVDTARLSTRKGHINFLNFPADKTTRNCFVANSGNVMVVCDFSSQEGVLMADISGDIAMTSSVVEGLDLHCLLTKIIYKELEGLSDDEIKKNHHEKRQQSKILRFAMSYGANAYTLHINQNIPIEEAQEIENAFKELHSGLYEWGDKVYQQSIKQGYIESADGWKLKLPKFDYFKQLEKKVKEISREEWAIYKQGKIEWKKLIIDETYIIQNQSNVDFYNMKKKDVSNFFKLKSEYQRLSLNSPIQSSGAMMTKTATLLFFEWIIENNLLWKVKICNAVHDELVVECDNSIKDLVNSNLERCMVEGGNKYLTNLTIKAESHYNSSWGLAK